MCLCARSHKNSAGAKNVACRKLQKCTSGLHSLRGLSSYCVHSVVPECKHTLYVVQLLLDH
eukprot:6186177-Pleurochrysis_carterae.AAC.1